MKLKLNAKSFGLLKNQLKLSRVRKHQVGVLIASFFLISSFQNCSVGKFAVITDMQNGVTDLGSDLPSMPVGGGAPGGSGSLPGPGGSPPALPPPVPVGGTMTTLKLQSLSTANQSNVPFTFGQTFPQGAIKKTETMAGRLISGTVLNLQVEAKATHPDGSIRHAIISGVLPSLASGATESLELIKAQSSASSSGVTPQALLSAGFGASVTISLGGVVYSASVKDHLAAGQYKSWLSGSYVNEWLVVAPLKDSSGKVHPHLTARFDIRSYTGLNRARADVTIENTWAYEPNPQTYDSYDVQIHVGGQVVYTKAGMKHFHHARWRKVFWWGAEPALHVKHDRNYLIQSRAIPFYDPSVTIAESVLVNIEKAWTGAKTEPMNYGVAQPYMGTTGGRPDIGLNPGWVVDYLLSQDVRAKKTTLGQGELSGSWSMHFRDKNTDLPLSILDYPYATQVGTKGDSYNKDKQRYEKLESCTAGDCTGNSQADISHHPNQSYVPYLVTGDHYYLEELQFWAMFMVFSSNPYYRDFEKGLMKSDQLRGQGWALRTLGEAGYITPDDHPLKSAFNSFVDHNLNWYNENYTNNPSANQLGIIINGYTLSYNGNRGIAPWMDDFFTQAIGHLTELGFTKAEPLLKWKAKFSIARMTDPEFCWISAGIYSLNVRDSETSPFYTTMGEAYRASLGPEITNTACASPEMAAAFGLKVGEMTGYALATGGYPSNMQPALAYSTTSGAANGLKAWQIFNDRPYKPNYSEGGAQFAIVPRQ